MIYSTYNWLEIEEECLNDEQLIEVFVEDIHKTVYVLHEGKLEGVISHGDFFRYTYEDRPLIQKSFTKCTLQDEEKAEEILKAKANIYGIPVVDEEGHIVREWRKEVTEEYGGFSNCILFGLYEQFLLDRDGYLNIMVMDLSDKKDAETAKKINKEAEGKLLIIDRKDILNINKYYGDSKLGVVYDCIQKYAGFNGIVYKRLGVKAEFLKKVNTSQNDVDHALEFYSSVGILGSEAGELSDEYKQAHAVYIFDDNKFTWNEDKNCFEYNGYIENDKVPEILWVSCCVVKNPCVIYKDKFIPVGSSRYPTCVEYYWYFRSSDVKFSDYDIVYNVIPRLKNKIKIIVLSNIANEYETIKGFDVKEAQRRTNSIVDYKKCIPNHFFNMSACISAKEVYDKSVLQVWNKRGYQEYKDCRGKYININRGERLVLGNPKNSEHTLWLFGPCLIMGTNVDDASNIGSILRKKINNNYYIKNMGATYETKNLCIRDAVLTEGDILVIYAYDTSIYENAGIKPYSLRDVYDNCPDLMEHIIDTLEHADAYLTEKIAERIYEILVSENILEKCDDKKNVAEIPQTIWQMRLRKEKDKLDVPQGIKEWLSGIQCYKGEDFLRTGAIVMNCNPFTLGHRYLIEQACEQVDKLLIFVLEEDKSFFKFKDRIEMVRLGTNDLDKVVVIPSGRYIISSETLPGYFEKEDNPEIVLDATDDLDFFAKYIAKELNISVRFAGEEPIDGYTRQYNQAMSKVLPENYIEFVEIPRKEEGGSVISASRVRKLLKEKNYADIKKLVLPQVYEYLSEHYFGGCTL